MQKIGNNMIQVEEIKLSRVKTNKENPRTITKDKFDKLVNSILVFPKMLQLRPIVVDGKMTALGGNMRNEALRVIAKMQPEEIAERLAGLADFVKKTKGERDALVEYWGKWLENPTAYIVKAGDLSEQEREQFIVKDNVSFGTWNYDALSSKWDSSLLSDWGMDVWQAAPAAFQPDTNATGYVPGTPDESEVDDSKKYNQSIVTPVYEPTGNQVAISELYEHQKTDDLLADINAANIPDDVKRFLRYAAYRHTEFNFEKIADYYVNATKEVQKLMEDSVLIILDYDNAIEKGFVHICQNINSQQEKDYEYADD